ncbi:hypothetical protein [Microtetraspora malaysiensis]|uniref:hypothetical protein n=1 Tax=Microtetraspora malaysiensis TaxID=161358 RepID=UPI0008346485|nr:hypothetical protein [Microtetraspora malaysiensis]
MAYSTSDPGAASSSRVAIRLWTLRVAQIVGAGAVGALMTVCLVPLLIFGMLIAGGAGLIFVSIPVGIVGTVGLLAVVALLTGGASSLASASRVGWAILVFVGGTAGWITGALIFQGGFPGPRGAVLVYSGIPFALAAIACMGRWAIAISLLTAVAVLATLLHVR